MSFSSKNIKKIKIQYQKESIGILVSWNFKLQVNNLNFDQTSDV